MGVAGDTMLFEGWLQGVDATKLLLALLPVWMLGAFIGMLVRYWHCWSYCYSLVKACAHMVTHTTGNAVTPAKMARDQHALWRLLAFQSLRRAVAPLRFSSAWLRDRQACLFLQESFILPFFLS